MRAYPKIFAQGLGLGSIKSAEIRAAGRIVLAPVWEAGREGSSRIAAGGGRVGMAQLPPGVRVAQGGREFKIVTRPP